MRLTESVSFKTTINAITAALGSPLTQIYATLTDMASHYFAEKGTMKGFPLAASSVGSKWFQTFYVNRLQGDLFDLVKYYPRQSSDLRELLSSRPASFGELSKELPEILIELSDSISMPSVKKNAIRWQLDRTAYAAHLRQLKEQEAAESNAAPDEKRSKPTSDGAAGQQNAQVDGIVNSVLKQLPSKVAADIRQAIARKPDKLQALQQELMSRNINLSECSKFDIKTALHEIASGVRSAAYLHPTPDAVYITMESALAEMQAVLIKEGNFPKSTLAAVPSMRIHPDLDNSSPYAAYRYGVAMAGGPEGNAQLNGPVGQKMITLGFSPADDAIIAATDKLMKSKSKKLSTRSSTESATNTKSPVAKIKRNKYGV